MHCKIFSADPWVLSGGGLRILVWIYGNCQVTEPHLPKKRSTSRGVLKFLKTFSYGEFPFHLQFSVEWVAFRTFHYLWNFRQLSKENSVPFTPSRNSRNFWLSSHPFLSLDHTYYMKRHLYTCISLIYNTVEQHLTATAFIRPPRFWGYFFLALTKAQWVIYSFYEPIKYGHSVNRARFLWYISYPGK